MVRGLSYLCLNMKTRTLFLLIVLLAVIIGGYSFINGGQPDFSIEITEVASDRNPNNTGPVHRVYAVTVSDAIWEDMKGYGEIQPYTKYGTTRVYFFSEDSQFPTEVNYSGAPFGAKFEASCLAVYEKNATGLVSLRRYPFR